MIKFSVFGRLLFGIAYLIYGYLHFAYTSIEVNLVPNGLGIKAFWVYVVGICWWAVALSFFTNIGTKLSGILASIMLLTIFLFTVIPHFNGISSWVNTATIFAMIGGSLMVASNESKWIYKKIKK